MCGRFTIMLDASEAKEAFDLQAVPADWRPRFNVAPSQLVAVVVSADERKTEWMRWGLIPSWAKEASIGNRLINARAETVMEKPSFRGAFSKRRCLILADGFYEWQREEGRNSTPYLFQRVDAKPFAMAGLWEIWRSPEGEMIKSCTILTTSANGVVAPVHERMPVMMRPDASWNWLRETDPMRLYALLVSYAEADMKKRMVSRIVNDPANDAPAIVNPV